MNQLETYIIKQLNTFIPDTFKINKDDINHQLRIAMERTIYGFSHIQKKYYNHTGSITFNHLHGDHYAVLLYYLSNELFLSKQILLAEKVFILNKTLHSVDIFYSISLPDIFMLVHPLGSVIGNARFNNYLVIYQNCTIGSDENEDYPVFGEQVLMYSRSSVIGKCTIGNNVVIGANTFIINTDIPDNSIVVGNYPNLKIIKNETSVLKRKFV